MKRVKFIQSLWNVPNYFDYGTSMFACIIQYTTLFFSFFSHSVSMNCICCNQCYVTVAFWRIQTISSVLWKSQPLHLPRFKRLFFVCVSHFVEPYIKIHWRMNWTWIWFDAIFHIRGSCKPFVGNAINIKYVSPESRQRKFSIICWTLSINMLTIDIFRFLISTFFFFFTFSSDIFQICHFFCLFVVSFFSIVCRCFQTDA